MNKLKKNWILLVGIVVALLFLTAFLVERAAPTDENFTLEQAAEAIDGYLAAYGTAIDRGWGPPERATWQEALDQDGGYFLRISHNALDRAFGWDFMFSKEQDPRARGQIRSLESPEISRTLLETVRMALNEAIINESTEDVSAQINGFFSIYPAYKPMHTGRCYDHGHDDYTFDNPGDCIAKSLSYFATFVIDQVNEGVNPKTLVQQPSEVAPDDCNCYYDWDSHCAIRFCDHNAPCSSADHPSGGKQGIAADGLCPE